jgi:predicted DsbA family dithiol-disulfide isomerase
MRVGLVLYPPGKRLLPERDTLFRRRGIWLLCNATGLPGGQRQVLVRDELYSLVRGSPSSRRPQVKEMSISTRRDASFSSRMLCGLLAVSMLTNIVIIMRTASIDWHRFVHQDQSVPALDAADHIRGNPGASVTIIEYSDFFCAFCARFHDVLKAAVAADSQVRWVYRHRPLPTLHPSAVAAAEAAECAAEQGRFWEYSDALFERQQKLGESEFSAIAAELNVDPVRFVDCRKDGNARRRVTHHATVFAEGHLSGTPTWFVNGTRFEGAASLEQVQRAIAAARSSRP